MFAPINTAQSTPRHDLIMSDMSCKRPSSTSRPCHTTSDHHSQTTSDWVKALSQFQVLQAASTVIEFLLVRL